MNSLVPSSYYQALIVLKDVKPLADMLTNKEKFWEYGGLGKSLDSTFVQFPERHHLSREDKNYPKKNRASSIIQSQLILG